MHTSVLPQASGRLHQQRCLQHTPAQLQHRRQSHATACSSSPAETRAPGSLQELRTQLEAAIGREDYQQAATLRDELSVLQRSASGQLEELNSRFYKAFEGGSYQEMEQLWGSGPHVQCMHPLANCVRGRADVLESWRLILKNGNTRIRVSDVYAVAGDGLGIVTCVEEVDSGTSRGRIAATNVFEMQAGEWKLVHHQGGPAPRMMSRP